MNKQRYTVTAALPYANGPLHLGHIAGVYLPADIFVRFLKMKGHDVVFICGSDEHGAAITLRAKKEGITPKEIVDKYHQIISDSFQRFGIQFDIYHRTSSEIHHHTAQNIFLKLLENNHFTVEKSQQFYDEDYKQFLADRYVTGECPKCSNPNAYGDQCEKCGSDLSPDELIHPLSTLSGKTPVLKETSHWYLPMQRHEQWLRKWILNGELDGVKIHDPKSWRNQVIGQCMSWIDGGLHSRAMTRDLEWGVRVPLENSEGKVLYVWLDAPIGYISATKQWAKDNNKNWEDYWIKQNNSENPNLIHFIGKDNIVFHAIIFPIILKAHGDFVLPKNVPASEFLNLEGDKFSTSRSWAVWLHEYIEKYPEKTDELKYTLTSISPETKDSEFTWKDYQSKVNNELLSILGNFVNRVTVLCQKYTGGKIPLLHSSSAEIEKVFEEIHKFPLQIETLLYQYKFRDAQAEVMNLARLGNKFLAETEPWKKAKTSPLEVESILYVSLQITAVLGQLLEPFLPNTAQKLRNLFKQDLFAWDDIIENAKPISGHKLADLPLLFNRIEDEMVQLEVDKLLRTKETLNTKIEMKKNITFDDFSQLDLRLATIIEAEKVPNAEKLIQLTLTVSGMKKTVVSGIAQYYSPQECIGKKVLMLLNLEPKKIKGIVSKGMILMAEDKNGTLSFISSEKEMEEGSIIR
ncbi:MAG: methionine--tRNA ligase [Flavobacteriia bacterium]|nr:methionine--tRNA ligase [Flavobacteriia bacterium]